MEKKICEQIIEWLFVHSECTIINEISKNTGNTTSTIKFINKH